MMNQGKDMDERGVPRPSAVSSPAFDQPNPGSGDDGNGTARSTAADSAAGSAGTWEGDVANAVMGGGGFLSTAVSSILGASPRPADAGTSSSAWPKLDPRQVITRLKNLQGNANLFNQGGIGLCTAAAFYHNMIQKNPSASACLQKKGISEQLENSPGRQSTECGLQRSRQDAWQHAATSRLDADGCPER